MENMFFEMLGVLIAFLTVIALLSLIVTALVQMTQAIFGVRGKNMHFALSRLLELVENDEPEKNAGKVLNATPAGLVSGEYDHSKTFLSRLWGPAVSWIEANELPKALKDADIGLNDNQVTQITERFDGMVRAVSKRLKKNMRGIAVAWALVVAIVFQISTPALIERLVTDPEFRTDAELAAKGLGDPGEKVSEQQAKEAKNRLAALNIVPWDNPSFYWSKDDGVQWAELLGVLITALLLSFGAPFWFDKLKQAVGLRDALRKLPVTTGSNNQTP